MYAHGRIIGKCVLIHVAIPRNLFIFTKITFFSYRLTAKYFMYEKELQAINNLQEEILAC